MYFAQKALDRLFAQYGVEEYASGLAPWQERRIAQILEDLQSGDNLIIQDISRLSRSHEQCLEILSIASKKGICVYVVNQSRLSFNLITMRRLQLRIS